MTVTRLTKWASSFSVLFFSLRLRFSLGVLAIRLALFFSFWHTHTVAVPQIGVGVFLAWLFRDRADGWVSEVFHSTDARRACRRGVIGSTMGAYPRDTGSNPVEGNGHFFPSYHQLYLSSFFDTHTHTKTELYWYMQMQRNITGPASKQHKDRTQHTRHDHEMS